MTRFAAPPIREGVRGKVRSNSRAGMQHDHLRRDATRGPLETPRRQNRPRRERRSLTGRRGTGKLIIALNGFRGVPRPPFGASSGPCPRRLSARGGEGMWARKEAAIDGNEPAASSRCREAGVWWRPIPEVRIARPPVLPLAPEIRLGRRPAPDWRSSSALRRRSSPAARSGGSTTTPRLSCVRRPRQGWSPGCA